MAPRPPRRPGTSTSNFGVGRRENHDASAFYDRFAMPELSDDEELGRAPEVDRIWAHDARAMPELPDASVALVVTSPPYFAGKAYEEALGEGAIPEDYVAYLRMLTEVFRECARVLEPGGRIAVNVANLGRRPYRSLSTDVIRILQDELGLLLRGEIIWQKARGAGGNCAWGSFRSSKNPVLRDLTERIIVASKGRFDRAGTTERRVEEGRPHDGRIDADPFLDLTLDLWEFPPESASRLGHPAPFPVELPERLIHLYTFRDDLVLDPFMGSGSTGVAAVRTGRHFAGYDTDEAYARAATERIDEARRQLEWEEKQKAQAMLPPIADTLRSQGSTEAVDFQRRATADGTRAKAFAHQLLEHCGFGDGLEENRKFAGGAEVNFVGHAQGNEWLFDVSGAFSSSRPGLKRTDTLWKALGKAAVLRTDVAAEEARRFRLVLLTTDVPGARTAGGRALAAAQQDGLIWDVLVMRDPVSVARLLQYASGDPAWTENPPARLTAYDTPAPRQE
ncbi:MAG: site-specific DNA-methyltransferase [Acidimicrobiales bacterium]